MQDPLHYHFFPTPGKIKIIPNKPLRDQLDLALAYSPGVAEACRHIIQDPHSVQELTIRRSLVAVISNGTAVLGLGNIGPLAAKPVMEGKVALFAKFGHLNAIDIEIQESNPEALVNIIASLEPSFGGINLEDIKAPECFYIEEQLKNRLNIPVFHDDQHGTAITVAAGVLNALQIVDKKLQDIRCVVSGAGAGSLACLNLLTLLGLRKENIFVCDSEGLIHTQRPQLNPYKALYAQETSARHLGDIIQGADLFLGASRRGVLNPEMVKRMAARPIIFALANPDPEIFPEEVYAVRPDALVGTGRSDYPNQVNNLLCFPYIFRGALDAGARQINEAMKVACVRALASIAQEGFSDILGHYGGLQRDFGPDYFIPRPFDPRLLERLPLAVATAAMDSGVARGGFCLNRYSQFLAELAYGTMPAFHAARKAKPSASLTCIMSGDPQHDRRLWAVTKSLRQFHIAHCQIVATPEYMATLDPVWEGPLLDPETFLPEVHQPCLFATLEALEKASTAACVGLYGCKLSAGWLFFCRATQPVDLQASQPLIEAALQAIRALGRTPHVVGQPYEGVPHSPTLPTDLSEGVGYLLIGYPFPLSFPEELLSCQEQVIGPLIIGPHPTWQALPDTTCSFRAAIERASFAVLARE